MTTSLWILHRLVWFLDAAIIASEMRCQLLEWLDKQAISNESNVMRAKEQLEQTGTPFFG